MSSVSILRGEMELDSELKDKVIEELTRSVNFAYNLIDDKQKEIDKLTKLYNEVRADVDSLKNEMKEIREKQNTNCNK